MRATHLLVVPLWLALAACPGFRLQTPEQFVALEQPEEREAYAYRATSADGVVLAVRELPNEGDADLQFWADAIRQRLRLGKGYALDEEKPVEAKSGHGGLLLRFGREEHGKQYRYVVALFVTDKRVIVVEAGGRLERYDARAAAVEAALRSFEIRGS